MKLFALPANPPLPPLGRNAAICVHYPHSSTRHPPHFAMRNTLAHLPPLFRCRNLQLLEDGSRVT